MPTLISVKSRGDVERDDLRDVQFGGLNNSRKVSFLTYAYAWSIVSSERTTNVGQLRVLNNPRATPLVLCVS